VTQEIATTEIVKGLGTVGGYPWLVQRGRQMSGMDN